MRIHFLKCLQNYPIMTQYHDKLMALLDEGLQTIVSGAPYLFNNAGNSLSPQDRSQHRVGPYQWLDYDISNSERGRAAFDIAYTLLDQLPGESRDALERVRNPALELLVSMFDEQKDKVQYARALIRTFGLGDTRENPRRMLPVFKAMMFLYTFCEHPEIRGRIKENSAYFPHDLFQERKLTLKELSYVVGGQILEHIPESLVSLLQDVPHYIPQLDFRDIKDGYNVRIANNEEFTRRYENQRVKRDILYGLHEVYCIIINSATKYEKKSRQLREFSCPPLYYSKIQELFLNYRINQALYALDNDKPFPRKKLGFNATIQRREEGFEVINEFRKTTTFYHKGTSYLPTKRLYPIAVHRLHKYWQTAAKLATVELTTQEKKD